jgi:hypothetical protein
MLSQALEVVQLRAQIFKDTVIHHWVFIARCFETVVASFSQVHSPMQIARVCRSMKYIYTNTHGMGVNGDWLAGKVMMDKSSVCSMIGWVNEVTL